MSGPLGRSVVAMKHIRWAGSPAIRLQRYQLTNCYAPIIQSRCASTVDEHDGYDIDLITLAKRPKKEKAVLDNLSKRGKRSPKNVINGVKKTIAPSSSVTNSKKTQTIASKPNKPLEPQGYYYFKVNFKKELSQLAEFLTKLKIKDSIKNGDYNRDQVFLKMRFIYRPTKSLNLMLTTFKRNPEFFDFFLFDTMGIDVKRKSQEVSQDDEFTQADKELSDQSKAKSTKNINEMSLGDLLNETSLSDLKPSKRKENTGIFKSQIAKPQKTQEINSFNDLLKIFVEEEEHGDFDKTVSKQPGAVKKVELHSSLDNALKKRLQVNAKNHHTEDLTPKKVSSMLSFAKHQTEINKLAVFQAERAFDYSRSIIDNVSFENRNYFTPTCIPNTLIPTSFVSSALSQQANLLRGISEFGSSTKDCDYCVLMKSGDIVTSKTNPLGDFFEQDDIFTLFQKLKGYENYSKNLQKLQKRRWILLGGDSQKGLLLFMRPVAMKRALIYERVKSGFAVFGAVFLCLLSYSYFLDYSKKGEETQVTTQVTEVK